MYSIRMFRLSSCRVLGTHARTPEISRGNDFRNVPGILPRPQRPREKALPSEGRLNGDRHSAGTATYLRDIVILDV